MAKRGSKDNSGVSMLALIRQVLVDGKVHSVKQIAEHMQQYMFKGMPMDSILVSVRNLLDHHSQIEKTPKGYRLKGGSNLSNLVRELLAEEYIPLSEREIVKLVAKKQSVPPDMIRLDLDSDSKITCVAYKSRKVYHLAGRKNVNEKVYKVLKAKNKPMTLEEIFDELEANHRVKRAKVIFLPRDESRVVKSGKCYTIKKKSKPKKEVAKPRHLVTRREMNKVVLFLETNQGRYSAEDLSKEVLDRPLEETNLSFKLSRERRLKREDDLFFYESEIVDQEVPSKVKERVEKEFYKVKARMMGSTEIQTVSKLLDRIYGVNMAHQEIGFYETELEKHLMSDEDSVLLLDNGWLHLNSEPRAAWTMPEEYSPVKLPDPPPPLQDEKVTEYEKIFLENKPQIASPVADNALIIPVSAIDLKYGLANIKSHLGMGFPKQPLAYEIVLEFPEENSSTEAFVLVGYGLVRGLETAYTDRLPFQGGTLILTPHEENRYRFSARFETQQEQLTLTTQRMTHISEKISVDDDLSEIIQQLFQSNTEKFMSCYQIWAEVNLLRTASRKDVLAVLKDYDCFLPIKSMEGFYSYDSSVGASRLSVAPRVAVPEPTPEPEKAAVVETTDAVASAADTADKPVETTETKSEEAVSAEKKARKKATRTKKETPKKRRKVEEEIPENLPDHLRKLKEFELKLPKLKMTPKKPASPVRSQRSPKPTTPTISSPRRPVRPSRPMRSRHTVRPTATPEARQPLVTIPPLPDKPTGWDSTAFINPDKGAGYADLQTALEVLKSFVSREPQVRRTDGSIVLFLDKNDLAIYFRVPPENQDCWQAWIPQESLDVIKESGLWLTHNGAKAKKSENGYWWATGKFKGPKGNFRDRNVITGVEILGKLLELMDKDKKA